MDNKPKTTEPGPGIYVRGVAISSEARTGLKKDGSRWVRVIDEIALQPGVAVLESYYDPAKDTAVQMEGDQVKSYPKLEAFKPVHLKAKRFRVFNDQLVIKDAEMLP